MRSRGARGAARWPGGALARRRRAPAPEPAPRAACGGRDRLL